MPLSMIICLLLSATEGFKWKVTPEKNLKSQCAQTQAFPQITPTVQNYLHFYRYVENKPQHVVGKDKEKLQWTHHNNAPCACRLSAESLLLVRPQRNRHEWKPRKKRHIDGLSPPPDASAAAFCFGAPENDRRRAV